MIFLHSRYGLPSWDNDAHGVWAVSTRWVNPLREEHVMQPQFTYQSLVDLLRSSGITQAQKNRLSGLNKIKSLLSRQAHDCVHADLVTHLDVTLARIDAAPELKQNRKRDLRNHARALGKLLEAHLGTKPRRGPQPRPDSKFTSVLVDAFRRTGQTRTAIAAASGINLCTFGDWLRGRQPVSPNLERIPKLEEALGLAPGALSEHTRSIVEAPEHDPALAYRRHVRKLQLDRYRAAVDDLPPQLVSEWHALLHERTSDRSNPRMKASGWAMKPIGKSIRNPHPLTTIGNKICSSADVIVRHLQAFAGWYCLPLERGGFGRDLREFCTVAWFAVPEAIDGYLKFRLERSERVNNSFRTFTGFVLSMCAPGHGYLTRRPKLFAGLPKDIVAGRSPKTLMREAEAMALSWAHRYEGTSRDPKVPLMSLHATGEVFQQIMGVVDKLTAEAMRQPVGTSERAVKMRDALLIALLLHIPLRAETFSTLQVGEASTDVLSRTADGYQLTISNIKNRRKLGGKAIQFPVPKSLTARIDKYIEHDLPVLVAGSGSKLLFPSRLHPDEPARHLSPTLLSRMRRYIPNSPGFSAHSMRHVVATEFIRRNPGAHVEAAKLLCVDVQTVVKYYDQNSHDYAFEMHSRAITDAQKAVERRAELD